MHTPRIAGLALLVAFSATTGAVRAETGPVLENCKAQVGVFYDDASDVRLVSKRRYLDGVRMKVAVRSHDPASGNVSSRFATCWVAAEDVEVDWGSPDQRLYAATDDDVRKAPR